MLSAVRTATGGGDWADGLLASVAQARVRTNEAVNHVEAANERAAQLHIVSEAAGGRDSPSLRLRATLLEVHGRVLQGWQALARALRAASTAADAASLDAAQSGLQIRAAQRSAEHALRDAAARLQDAAAKCWADTTTKPPPHQNDEDAGSDVDTKEPSPAAAAALSPRALQSLAEQRLLPFAGSIEVLSTFSPAEVQADREPLVRRQEREVAWTPCFQDLCKALPAVGRSGCLFGCLATITDKAVVAGACTQFCSDNVAIALQFTGDAELRAAVVGGASAGGQDGSGYTRSHWTRTCRATCRQRVSDPFTWGAHNGHLPGPAGGDAAQEDEGATGATGSGGILRAGAFAGTGAATGPMSSTGGGSGGGNGMATEAAALGKARLFAGDRWAECNDGVCGRDWSSGLSRSGCLNGCRAAVLGGVDSVRHCAQWCAETVDEVLGDPQHLGAEATRDLAATDVEDARAEWISICHVGCDAASKHVDGNRAQTT